MSIPKIEQPTVQSGETSPGSKAEKDEKLKELKEMANHWINQFEQDIMLRRQNGPVGGYTKEWEEQGQRLNHQLEKIKEIKTLLDEGKLIREYPQRGGEDLEEALKKWINF